LGVVAQCLIIVVLVKGRGAISSILVLYTLNKTNKHIYLYKLYGLVCGVCVSMLCLGLVPIVVSTHPACTSTVSPSLGNLYVLGAVLALYVYWYKSTHI